MTRHHRCSTTTSRSGRVLSSLAAVLFLTASDARGDAALRPVKITHGSPVEGDSAVVALLDDEGNAFCSGVLVSATEVLSAAHCLVGSAPRLGSIYFGSAPGAAGQRLDVAGFRVAPEFDASTRRADLAIIDLAEPAPSPPAVVRPALLTNASIGASVRIVGFGLTSSGESPQKRAGWARVGALSPDFIRIVANPALACQGDSGGPVLLSSGGVEHVIGIISHGDWLCADHTYAVKVAADSPPIGSAGERVVGGCAASPGLDAAVSSFDAALMASLLLGCLARPGRVRQRRSSSFGSQRPPSSSRFRSAVKRSRVSGRPV